MAAGRRSSAVIRAATTRGGAGLPSTGSSPGSLGASRAARSLGVAVGAGEAAIAPQGSSLASPPAARSCDVPRRVITPELFEDEWFGGLQDREQLIWVGLFGVLADDQGRLRDNAALIRSRLWPYRDVPAADVAAALDRFVADNRLCRYSTTKDGPLLQIVNWWKHQRPQWTARSPLPAPPGWCDRIRTRLNGEYVHEGWSEPGGFACGPQVLSGEPIQVNSSVKPSASCAAAYTNPYPYPNPYPNLHRGGLKKTSKVRTSLRGHGRA